jgi:UDP-N-acetylmuramate dehydrogenase
MVMYIWVLRLKLTIKHLFVVLKYFGFFDLHDTCYNKSSCIYHVTYMSVSLLKHNTLGLEQSCDELFVVDSKASLIETCLSLYHSDKALMILGGGSNVVFTEDFAGSVVKIATKGIAVEQEGDEVLLIVEAGESWHELVAYCVEHNFYGIENLALIPGTVGAAPIQNIGAYGVEFSQVCHSVEFLDLDSSQLFEISAEDCQFDYRESIFKQQLKHKAVITAVKIRLTKVWEPQLDYSPLSSLDSATVSPKQLFDLVCQIRQSKLPDPTVLGNVGSFFKNPIVNTDKFKALKDKFPELIGYSLEHDLVKLAAGWLIENAGLKGFSIGGASVHQQQALVLVNSANATGNDICQLALHVIDVIEQRFEISLETEPRMMAQFGEVVLS